MHPSWYWHHRSHYHGRPSRVLWFVIGAAAATYWHKRKEAATYGPLAGASGYCVRAPLQQPTPPSDGDADVWSTRGLTKAINSVPPAEIQMGEWTTEKKRIVEIQQQAGDKLAELSEATLDTVLTTVEVLKGKLAEYRAEREKRQQDEQQPKDSSQVS